MPVASRDIYTDITEGLFLLQLPHKSQLLASADSSSSLTRSSLAFVPPAFPLNFSRAVGSIGSSTRDTGRVHPSDAKSSA
ncbi:hypothetical protein PENNAL_c0090G10064 [Penicillium nalgiovense]|uniref:Uncharacterized protein n=1 Tax=Penicillium nalgiovense TaxID=60175 RepID=A0A1V6XDP9_PENNA|nr:hypothetical protein PENNAL_c0090G10064 [Penicillium nalgiovense]